MMGKKNSKSHSQIFHRLLKANFFGALAKLASKKLTKNKPSASKGYFLTIDAVLGISIILIMFSMLAMFAVNSPSETKSFEGVKQNASDAARTGFYLNQTNEDFPGLGMSISSASETGFCAHYFKYNPDNGAGQSAEIEERFCGEK